MLLEYYDAVMVRYKNEDNLNEIEADLRIPEYDALAKMIQNGIEEFNTKDLHFDWPSYGPNIEIPPIDKIKGPKKEDIYVQHI